MRKFKLLRWAVVVSVAALITSCSTTPPAAADARPRFHDDTAASVVLQFYKWDSIFMTRPGYRENGYLTELDRENLGRVLGSPQIQRDLAVVLLGYTFTEEDQAGLIRDWTTLLDGRGFRRIVFLRGGNGDKIDGLPIIHDSASVARL